MKFILFSYPAAYFASRKKKLAKAGTLDPLRNCFGMIWVGVHVGAVERRDKSPMYAKRLHAQPSHHWNFQLRMSVKAR